MPAVDMARGPRARSQSAYQGSVGRTQTDDVHVTTPRGESVVATVYTTIDAVSDPELVERLHAGTLHAVQLEDGETLRLALPVVYHDPAAELLVLVLGDAHRHRELEERIRLLERLRADSAAIPAYARNFAVVFGSAGLRAYLEQRAEQAVGETALERQRKELDARARHLDHVAKEFEAKAKELDAKYDAKQRAHDARAKELERQGQDVAREIAELERLRDDARDRVAAAIHGASEATTVRPAPARPTVPEESVTAPISRHDEPAAAEVSAGHGVTAGAQPQDNAAADDAVDSDDVETASTAAIIPAGADPLTTETAELPLAGDPWLEFAATGAVSSFAVQDGRVRLALVAGDRIARGLKGALDVRILLHRVQSYPVVALLIGPPAALRVPSPTQLAVLALEIGSELDRQVVGALAKQCELEVDVVVHGRPVRRVRLTAPLSDNAAFILRAADDHLRGIAADGETEPSFPRARDLVLGAGYDLLGLEHAEHAEFRDDRLAQLGTAQAVRRALAMARRFVRPSREDYLVCVRGFPLTRWRELRRHVLESAVAWGLWMGPELAQIAVSEGLARSRRDLVVKLEAGFETLRHQPRAFDIDADAAEDNQKALADEAHAQGVELRRKPANGAIKSEDVPVVSGSIEQTPTQGTPRQRSVDELLALLDDRRYRVSAAAELCDRGDPRAAAAVIAAAKKMSRAEAVRILGKSVKLGEAAAPPLLEGLRSSKAFLRHGCALALALLRTEEGTYAVIDLLLEEPTEIWREIARAIGQIGPNALVPFASRVGGLGDLGPQLGERVAWALAHIGVRGGKIALEQMAAGQGLMAPLAARALALLDNAARDEVRVVPGQMTRDVTVNRAFSRRFFEAIEPDQPELAHAALHDIDASGPLELEDGDLIVEEEEAELDESDLIQG
jgi:hypothetical protein